MNGASKLACTDGRVGLRQEGGSWKAANEGEKRWKRSVVCAVFTFLCFANAPSEKVPALQVKQVEAPANDIN